MATVRPESSRRCRPPPGVHLFDRPQLTIRDVVLPVRRGELHAVPGRERAVRLAIERDALEPARVVGDALAALDASTVTRFSWAWTVQHACVRPRLDAERLLPFV